MTTTASVPKSVAPIPTDLPQLLHAPKTPWHISPALFERLKKQETVDGAGKPFVAVQVVNSDPEYAFVLRYFQHQKPPHYGIKAIRCIHNPDQTMMFEGSMKGMEAAAKTFPPGWSQEEPKAQRAQTIERWKASVAPFSPFQIASSKRVDKFVGSKIIPLWHGSKQVESICSSGFTYFGKHHFFDKNAKAGAQASTDIGFFGSGIYFTNSSHYASMYHSGTLFLAWVSMREPYPVVNDVPIPKKGADMLKLQGKGAYQNYNAHYIPVTSTDPSSADNMIYHPCHATEQPAWDEYVVFERTQALPRFIVELGVDLPVAPSTPSVATVGALTDQLMVLLDNPDVKSDSVIFALLTEKSNVLLNLNSLSPLSPEDLAFYNRTLKLLDSNGEIRSFIKQQLTQLQPAIPKPNAKEDPPSTDKITKIATAATAATVVSSSAETLNQKASNAVSTTVSIDPKSLEKTPLFSAATAGNVELCKALLKAGADPYTIDENGFNVLHWAAVKECHELIPIFAVYKQLLNAKDINGYTPLMYAAFQGHPKACEALLTAGADPSLTDKSGKNVIHAAAYGGKHEPIPLFATFKQLLDAKDTNGDTPLTLASQQGHLKACEALLTAGADPSLTDKRGKNALHIAAYMGKHEVFPVFAAYKQLFDAKATDGSTPLMQAAYGGSPKTCDALLKAGANPLLTDPRGLNVIHFVAIHGKHEVFPVFADYKQLLNAKTTDGNTPLHLAAVYGHVKTCEALLQAGADPSIRDNYNRSAIDRANLGTSSSKDKIIKLLNNYSVPMHQQHAFSTHSVGMQLWSAAATTTTAVSSSGETLNQKTGDAVATAASFDPKSLEKTDADGNTLLLNAAKDGKVEFCKVLLKAGAKPSAINKESRTALYLAAREGRHEVIPLFAAHKRLLNAKDISGYTPLIAAACNGHPKACEALLKAGADPFITDNAGKNILHWASAEGQHEVISIFVVYKQLLNAKDIDGNTPLMLAAGRVKLKGCEALLKAGADPFILREGQNALHSAAQSGNHEVIPVLAANKQLLNAKDTNGNTPLALAAWQGYPKACEVLLKTGADPSIPDKNGHDALHVAAFNGKHEVIEVFACYKQLLNVKDRAGETPLMLAVRNHSIKTCEALLKAGADPSITIGGILGIGGRNALDYARSSKSKDKDEFIKLLSSYMK